MIQFSHSVVEVAPFEERGALPAAILQRGPSDAWYVRCRPLTEGGEGWEWSLEGKAFRVPLFPYLIAGTDPEMAIAFGAQLGLTAMADLVGGDEVVRAHLVVGYPTEDRGDHLRHWLGVAFQLRGRK